MHNDHFPPAKRPKMESGVPVVDSPTRSAGAAASKRGENKDSSSSTVGRTKHSKDGKRRSFISPVEAKESSDAVHNSPTSSQNDYFEVSSVSASGKSGITSYAKVPALQMIPTFLPLPTSMLPLSAVAPRNMRLSQKFEQNRTETFNLLRPLEYPTDANTFSYITPLPSRAILSGARTPYVPASQVLCRSITPKLAPIYCPTMSVSKVQLLNNQHLEPVDDKVYQGRSWQDLVVVDSSTRECNEWSIYSIPLPTQLHVKCQCFPST